MKITTSILTDLGRGSLAIRHNRACHANSTVPFFCRFAFAVQKMNIECQQCEFEYFYRAMHFSAKRGIAIACRLSVSPSVCDVGGL